MALDTLEIFGDEFTNVTGIKATDNNNQIKTYIRPQGNLAITANSASTDVTQYATVSVNVPTGSTINNQNKTVTPFETQQSVSADSGYTGLGTVTVEAISSTYVGTGITRRSSTDLTVSGATVTAPAGYYSAAASKSVATMTLPTAAASSATSGYTSKTIIGRSTAAQYINIPPGYNSTGAYYVISATPNGSVTAPSSISGTAASVSTGTNTLTLTKTVSVTPNVTTAGYISSGTAGNSSVSLTASVTTKAAATITPTTTNQTIAAGTYLTGTQTIAGDADLVASNIKKDVNIFGVTGTYEPNDFVITLTQDSNENWVPDCTYAEAYAAYQAGKNIVFYCETANCGGQVENQYIYYEVDIHINENSGIDGHYTTGTKQLFYIFSSNGIIKDSEKIEYDTTLHSTATASDVISGQYFYNGSGLQKGTLVLQNYYTGSSAPSSSTGSNGDLYLQS